MHRELENQLPHPEIIERAVHAVRWFALAIVFDLSFFDQSTDGVLVPSLNLILIVAAYDLLILLLRPYLRARRQILNPLALDTIIATLAVYLTGGVHSAFFILYIYVAFVSALYLNLVPTILVTLVVIVLYVLTCLANPAGIQNPDAINILAIKLTLAVVIALASTFLLEGIRREHAETEREQILAARLAALNDIFHQATASLDLEHVLHTIAQAACHLVSSQAATICLYDADYRQMYVAAVEGMPTVSLSEAHWDVDENLLRIEKPYSLEEAGKLPSLVRHLLDREKIQSVLSVPLVLEHIPIGLLSVHERTRRTYSEEDLTLLVPLAQEAALAIRNAHLYKLEKQQVEQLKTLERLQDNFVSYVSHELRTPLTSIKTSIALLQEMRDGGSNMAQNELIETIAHNTSRLEAMVTDLLQMTQLEAGKLALSLQPTDLNVIVERAVTSLRPLFDDKEQSIEFHSPETMERVVADRRRLEQVLVNLLSNAYKYAPRGARVVINLVDQPAEVEFSISDNGPGIPLAEQERIFDKFYVGAETKNRSAIGLGLYITRHLVELFGGRIWVESEPGHGSTFRFTLPKKELSDEDSDR